jgi:hypothetical protein
MKVMQNPSLDLGELHSLQQVDTAKARACVLGPQYPWPPGMRTVFIQLSRVWERQSVVQWSGQKWGPAESERERLVRHIQTPERELL